MLSGLPFHCHALSIVDPAEGVDYTDGYFQLRARSEVSRQHSVAKTADMVAASQHQKPLPRNRFSES